MESSGETVLAERLERLLDHLGLERAHIAACMPRDWEGLALCSPGRIASLSLIAPMGVNSAALEDGRTPLLIVAGDRGRPAKDADSAAARLPHARRVVLRDYFSPSWADFAGEKGGEIAAAMKSFIAATGAARGADAPAGSAGEIAGITYEIHGSGAPLLLLPLALSPAQWEPILPQLNDSFQTITLGGAHLGMVAHLEARAESGYMRVIRQLASEADIQAGQSIVEVGCGPGALARRLARWTHGHNPIVAVDVNRYLLGEARALARADGTSGAIEFREGNAEKLPLPNDRFDIALACTMLEEGDADRMLRELVRITRPGGRVGVVVRAVDMPRWVNLPLGAALKAKVEDRGLIGGNVVAGGCADSSLYGRMRRAGLSAIANMPQWASHGSGERLRYMHDRIAAALDGNEIEEWRLAVAAGEADGTFFIAEPFHCALGTKP